MATVKPSTGTNSLVAAGCMPIRVASADNRVGERNSARARRNTSNRSCAAATEFSSRSISI